MTNIDPIIDAALAQVKPPQKVSLAEMLSKLDEMESALDACGELTHEMLDEHFKQTQDVTAKTDKLIGFIEMTQRLAAAASEKAEAYKLKARSYENALDRTKAYAKYLMKTYPAYKFEGTKGRLALQRTAPKLVLTMPKHRFSSENVIPADCVGSVPDDFKKLNVIYVYNNEAIREALKNGSDTPIGRLDENESVRVKL